MCLILKEPVSWWVWRGIHRRSHSELDPESPLRQWYCGLSHGRVGPRQLPGSENVVLFSNVFQSIYAYSKHHLNPCFCMLVYFVSPVFHLQKPYIYPSKLVFLTGEGPKCLQHAYTCIFRQNMQQAPLWHHCPEGHAAWLLQSMLGPQDLGSAKTVVCIIISAAMFIEHMLSSLINQFNVTTSAFRFYAK